MLINLPWTVTDIQTVALNVYVTATKCAERIYNAYCTINSVVQYCKLNVGTAIDCTIF